MVLRNHVIHFASEFVWGPERLSEVAEPIGDRDNIKTQSSINF